MQIFFTSKIRKSCLSQVLFQCAALIQGGEQSRTALLSLKTKLEDPVQKKNKVLWQEWKKELFAFLQEASDLGSSCSDLLNESARYIRQDEKRMRRLEVLNQQFSFQGAILFILPWSIFFLNEHWSFNVFAGAGAFFQMTGFVLFFLYLKSLQKEKIREVLLLRKYLFFTLLRIQAGMSLAASLSESLNVLHVHIRFYSQWAIWLEKAKQEESLSLEDWDKDYEFSPNLGEALFTLLLQGAPAKGFLVQYLDFLEDCRQTQFEERLARAPSVLSLVFVAFFTPAVFCLLLANLWPSLKFFLGSFS